MPKFLIYNFSGYPGDLYQLIPWHYLASYLKRLNEVFGEGSCELWDRANLTTALELSPQGLSAGLLRVVGKKVFQRVRDKKPIPHSLLIPFKLLLDYADKYLKSRSLELTRQDADRILNQNIELVFLNFFQGPGLEPTLALAAILKKERPQIKIIGIGQRVSWFREYSVWLSANIDAYCMGTSSSSSVVALAKGLPYARIPNLVFKNNSGEPVYTGLTYEGETRKNENLPFIPLLQRGKEGDFEVESSVFFPDYGPNYQGISGKIPLFEVSLANEACPFQCNFCVRPVNYGTKWIKRNIQDVIAEMEYLIGVYNARLFRISDSTPPPGMLTELAAAIIEKGLGAKIAYSAFSRCYDNPAEDFKLLKKSGCQAIFLGLESGSPKILNEILNKKVSLEGIEKTVRLIYEAGIFVVVSLMMPSPCETYETQEETYNLLKRLSPYIGSALIQPAGVYPNTEWFNHPEKYGIYLSPDYFKKACGYPIEPLKPLRLWPPFPFSYDLFEKKSKEVSFLDIVNCFVAFESRVRKELCIPNIQDYGYVLSMAREKNPQDFSLSSLEYMVTRNTGKLAELLNIRL